PLQLGPIRYATTRGDVYGIAWVMNHAASYVLVSIGVLDLAWTLWLRQPFGPVLCLWIAGWWLVRAATQLYLGRRRGDWRILPGFALLGLLHLALAVSWRLGGVITRLLRGAALPSPRRRTPPRGPAPLRGARHPQRPRRKRRLWPCAQWGQVVGENPPADR